MSGVDWDLKTIGINTEDLKPAIRSTGTLQLGLAHELGHTIGNSKYLVHCDEYSLDSEFNYDKESIMHKGMIIRKRHFDYLLIELNSILPNTEFFI